MNAESFADRIRVNTQSSIRIESDRILYFDPFEIREEAGDADIVFITHNHGDHYDLQSIAKIRNEKTKFVFPEKMCAQAMQDGIRAANIVSVKSGERLTVEGLPVETVPAYNSFKPFHLRMMGWVGYIVTMEGLRIYVAGDTDATSAVKSVQCDVALLPIGGKFTMNAKDAAEVLRKMKPSVCIPTHYGSIVGTPEDGKKLQALVAADVKVILKL